MPKGTPQERQRRGGRGGVLDGRVAVVTGAGRGVGAALARELSAYGMRLALLGREVDTLSRVAAGLPGEARCFEVDVTDRAAMARVAFRVADELGPASVVVANAGIAATGPFESGDPGLWERVVEVNLLGSATTARVFLPHLRRTRGYFLQIASTAAFGAAPMMSAYCASKAGAESFAQSLRAEIAPEGIAVGIAYLHWTGTDMTRDIGEHPVLLALRAAQPRFAGRVQAAGEVARRLRHGIELRATSVHCPAWLRLVQPLRPLFPPLVARVARTRLARLDPVELDRTAGVLGPGGEADWRAAHRVT
ncbi:SDR family oxidoreductase [Streptomyces sp. NPDC005805]|uniref:SDR family oxidoreductase n=1 Tax=Streptomyces sp. NPDC005805 TaxID=3157068 RepID=UPI0033EF0FFC